MRVGFGGFRNAALWGMLVSASGKRGSSWHGGNKMVVVDVACGLVLACLKVCCMLALGAAIGLLLAPSVASATVRHLGQVTAISSGALGTDAPAGPPVTTGSALSGVTQALTSPASMGEKVRRIGSLLDGE